MSASTTRSPAGGVTELRLALVCYGGVSLAIYMHGVTKELHKLLRASREFDRVSGPDAANPFAGDPGADSERAYFEALRDVARDGRPLRVSIDIVAGTSAGGINGVCLGKVIARNGTQQKLKSLWIEEGDLKTLLRAPGVGGWRTRAALAAVRTLVAPSSPQSPLRGDRMSRLLYDALTDMDTAVDEQATLIAPGGSLELFVTTTDLHGFEVLVPTGAGGASQRDRYNAQVLEFRSTGENGFTGPTTAVLAFAARATSCFPGAFPPVSLQSFATELEEPPPRGGLLAKLRLRRTGSGTATAETRLVDPAAVARHFRYRYNEMGMSAADAWFVDGGVLDNAPFDLVVQAIANKRAETEVVRRIVYIQPDPGHPLMAGVDGGRSHRPDAQSQAPGWLPGLWTALSTVKGSHSILRELLEIRDLNLRIADVAAVAEHEAGRVMAAIEDAMAAASTGAARPWELTARAAVDALAAQLHGRARSFAGDGYETYCRLKAEAAGRRLADEVAENFSYPPDSSRTSFVRAAISAWATLRPEWQAMDGEALGKLLGPADLPYRERRLLFILAGINALYATVDSSAAAPSRASLDRVKARAWDLLDDVRRAPRDAVTQLPRDTIAFLDEASLDTALYGDPAAFARAHDAAFTALFTAYHDALAVRLGDGSQPLWRGFVTETGGWPAPVRAALLSRYLGFPLWDALIFPIVALSQLPQFTPIGVSQFSPLTAKALVAPADGKLKGVGLHHFGGFTDAAWRENDYLWGRLDAAEQLLTTLRVATGAATATAPNTPEEAAAAAGPRLQAALESIIDAETDLTRITQVRRALLHQIRRLPQP